MNAIAAGHNLDDVAAALLGSLLRWQERHLTRQHPYMPLRAGLVRRIKPLCLISKRETAADCIVRKIDYILGECPLVKGASSLVYKEALNNLEWEKPGIKKSFLGFLEKGRFLFDQEDTSLSPWINCGQPTGSRDLCGFCRQMKQFGLSVLDLVESIAYSLNGR